MIQTYKCGVSTAKGGFVGFVHYNDETQAYTSTVDASIPTTDKCYWSRLSRRDLANLEREGWWVRYDSALLLPEGL